MGTAADPLTTQINEFNKRSQHMQGTFKSILVTVSVFIIGISLTACKSEQQKKEPISEAVPVTVGKVQRVQ